MAKSLLKKRLLVNAALVAGLIALGLLLWLGPDTNSDKKQPLTSLEKKAVTRIAIERPDKQTLVLEKHNGKWRIREPLRIDADDFRVNNILNVLDATSHRRYPLGERDPTEFGLKPPVAILTVNGLTLSFGHVNFLESKRYVLIEGTLHLTDDNYLPLLTRGLNALIDHRPVPEDMVLNALEFPDFSLHRADTGGWRIAPDDPALGADTLQTKVDQWKRLEAADALHHPHADYENNGELTFTGNNGETLHLQIVNNTQATGLFRPDGKIFYSLNKNRLETLLAEPSPDQAPGSEHVGREDGAVKNTDSTE